MTTDKLTCKNPASCEAWNRYYRRYYGTETFEWFLKACYEYLDKKQKSI